MRPSGSPARAIDRRRFPDMAVPNAAFLKNGWIAPAASEKNSAGLASKRGLASLDARHLSVARI